ncbi:hypothetical protein PFISCL1PPCAC_22705, partial [Pristionchus fissidentatus]
DSNGYVLPMQPHYYAAALPGGCHAPGYAYPFLQRYPSAPMTSLRRRVSLPPTNQNGSHIPVLMPSNYKRRRCAQCLEKCLSVPSAIPYTRPRCARTSSSEQAACAHVQRDTSTSTRRTANSSRTRLESSRWLAPRD